MLTQFIKLFTKEQILIEKDVVQIDKKFFLVPESLRQFTRREPVYLGTYLGQQKGKRFIPSFTLLELIAKKTTQKTIVDDKTAWLFLCGRDILDKPLNFKEKTSILVLSKEQEVLGYGVVHNEDKFKLGKSLDRGDFLRRERAR